MKRASLVSSSALSATVALAALILIPGSIPAQVIFQDGFESGDTSAWPFSVTIDCDTVEIAGACWWFGESNLSCDEVCADHGGYSPITASFAGSGGSNANCETVLSYLDVANAAPVTETVDLIGTTGLGCGSDFSTVATSYRLTSPTTAEASSAATGGFYFRRACGCESQPPPGPLSYSGSPFAFQQCLPMTPLSASVTGYVASFSIAPALPAGLELDELTGEISGVPTALASPTVHTVTAANAGGTSTTDITIEVFSAAPSGLSYPNDPFTFSKNVAIQEQVPVVTGCVDSFAVSPALPAGLSLDPSTGAITGTPTMSQPATDYTVTATNTSGSTNDRISIEVVGTLLCDGTVVGGYCWWFGQNNESCDQVCSNHGLYNDATRTFAGSDGNTTTCSEVLTAVGASNATPVTSTSTLNGLSGLGCGSDYSDIATSYRLTSTTTAAASSEGNSTDFRRACACNDQPPPGTLSYPGSPFSFQRCVDISTLSPEISGYVAYYSISPSLPSGLSFDTTTGEISGTPNQASSATSYTVTAHNAGGDSPTSISIEVISAAPSALSYAGSPFTFTQDSAIQPQTPSVIGCVTTFGVSPALPAGLSLHPSTGVISGTPTGSQAATSYTVTATNSVGTDDVEISITITAAF